MRKLLSLANLCFFIAASLCGPVPNRPNIIIMLMDDMGWFDLGCFGNPIKETPHLDRMAAEGMLFTDFYTANPLCSPSRAAMLTGRLPIRNGFYTNNIRARNAYTPQNIVGGIDQWEVLLPEMLSKLGYRSKIIGKWHLGHRPQFMPLKHGFDEFFGSTNCHFGPFNNKSQPNIAFFRDDKMIGRYFEDIKINKKEHLSNLTQWYTEEALEFIDKHSNGTPFFLYWTPDALHEPTYRSKQYRGRSRKGTSYGDALIEIDDSVGRILDKIRSIPALAKNTFVFFASDNGAALYAKTEGGNNGPLLCGKETTFEGGIRDPAIAWWPSVVPQGIVSQQTGTVMDLFATIANMTEVNLPTDRQYDSVSLLPALINGSEFDRSIFYYRGDTLMAVRHGNYKAHFWTYSNSWDEFNHGIDFCPGQVLPGVTDHQLLNHTVEPVLFHLMRDPSEHYPIGSHTKEYKAAIAKLIKIYDQHKIELVPGKPLLNWCDSAVMHWSPPGCGDIKSCLPVPKSKPFKCHWPH